MTTELAGQGAPRAGLISIGWGAVRLHWRGELFTARVPEHPDHLLWHFPHIEAAVKAMRALVPEAPLDFAVQALPEHPHILPDDRAKVEGLATLTSLEAIFVSELMDRYSPSGRLYVETASGELIATSGSGGSIQHLRRGPRDWLAPWLRDLPDVTFVVADDAWGLLRGEVPCWRSSTRSGLDLVIADGSEFFTALRHFQDAGRPVPAGTKLRVATHGRGLSPLEWSALIEAARALGWKADPHPFPAGTPRLEATGPEVPR